MELQSDHEKDIRTFFNLIGAFARGGVPGNAQDTTVKQIPPKPTAAIDGKSLFHEYCAVCHGPNGNGDGPAASALKIAPGDLTQISSQNEGKFPEERIMRDPDGRRAGDSSRHAAKCRCGARSLTTWAT